MSDMYNIFLDLLNMSLTAIYIILAIILLRLIFKKAPKALFVIMWGLVGIRLICPLTIDSFLSLIPSAYPIPQNIVYAAKPEISTGIPIINSITNPLLQEYLSPNIGDSANPMQIVLYIATYIWLIGIALMLVYTTISYIRMRRKTKEAVAVEENVFALDHISTPFIFGFFKPRIYVPSDINESNMPHVKMHEKAHLERYDHVLKPISFLILTIHWFNPFVWLAYILLCRDIELACDEKVLRHLDRESKILYSKALLDCSSPRRTISACPLAFGETSVKMRVKNIINYKKPAFWLVIAAIIACVIATICFMTNPKDPNTKYDFSQAESYQYYRQNNGENIDKASLHFNTEEKTFCFCYSFLSSYLPVGTYTEDETYIICKTYEDDLVYTFKKGENALIFEAESSSPVPSYRYKASDAEIIPCVPDRAIFVPYTSSTY